MENETIFEWSSPEHHFDRKSNDWYWILGIVCLGAAILAFYFDNFLFGIFIIIAGFTISLLSYRETREMSVKITTKGIVLGRALYPWLSLKSFWIEDEHVHGARVLLHPAQSYLPLLIVPIHEEVALGDLREVLLEFLEEEFLQESILHQWFDKLIAR